MEEKAIDDLVAMIDQFMSTGGGHMDISTAEDGSIQAKTTQAKTVTITPSMECTPGRDMACGVPTLFEGMDDDHTEQ